uniref:Uncharacterized protein n=1 Tax=Anguilla anguilla TaxID=7936 RepID=A0A0E9SQR9_ANGAN
MLTGISRAHSLELDWIWPPIVPQNSLIPNVQRLRVLCVD